MFAHLGYEIGGTTYEQEHGDTGIGWPFQRTAKDLILVLPGSISAGNSSHVGISMAGDGQMIHCSGGRANTFSNPGRGVWHGSVAADGRRYVIRRVATAVYTG